MQIEKAWWICEARWRKKNRVKWRDCLEERGVVEKYPISTSVPCIRLLHLLATLRTISPFFQLSSHSYVCIHKFDLISLRVLKLDVYSNMWPWNSSYLKAILSAKQISFRVMSFFIFQNLIQVFFNKCIAENLYQHDGLFGTQLSWPFVWIYEKLRSKYDKFL